MLSFSPLLLPQVFLFLQLNTINDLHLRSIQTLCLHLSYSTPLRKTLTVNHYLRIEYFQHIPGFSFRVIKGEMEHLLHKRLTADPVRNFTDISEEPYLELLPAFFFLSFHMFQRS